MEHSAIEHSAMEHSAMECSALDACAIERSAMEHSAMERSAIIARAAHVLDRLKFSRSHFITRPCPHYFFCVCSTVHTLLPQSRHAEVWAATPYTFNTVTPVTSATPAKPSSIWAATILL